jgi:hypothetical protein
MTSGYEGAEMFASYSRSDARMPTSASALRHNA